MFGTKVRKSKIPREADDFGSKWYFSGERHSSRPSYAPNVGDDEQCDGRRQGRLLHSRGRLQMPLQMDGLQSDSILPACQTWEESVLQTYQKLFATKERGIQNQFCLRSFNSLSFRFRGMAQKFVFFINSVHRIASRWPQGWVGLLSGLFRIWFVYICLLAQFTLSHPLMKVPHNLEANGTQIGVCSLSQFAMCVRFNYPVSIWAAYVE